MLYTNVLNYLVDRNLFLAIGIARLELIFTYKRLIVNHSSYNLNHYHYMTLYQYEFYTAYLNHVIHNN